MLWDDKFFYVAAEMEEPHVWGTLTKHDSVIFHDNDFEVFIDPNGDNARVLRVRNQRAQHGWDLFLESPTGREASAERLGNPGLRRPCTSRTLNDPATATADGLLKSHFPGRRSASLRISRLRPNPERNGE